MLVAFSVAPLGSGESVSEAVADAVRIVRESGLPNRTDAMFTTIEGDWDEVMDVVRRATEAVGRHGNRVSLVLKADIRPGHTGELAGKVDRVEAALREGARDAGRPPVTRTVRGSRRATRTADRPDGPDVGECGARDRAVGRRARRTTPRRPQEGLGTGCRSSSSTRAVRASSSRCNLFPGRSRATARRC